MDDVNCSDDATDEPIRCPTCKGEGKKHLHLHYARGKGRSGWQWKTCWRCNGSKVIDQTTFEQIETGTVLHDMMNRKGLKAWDGHEKLGLTDRCLLSNAVLGRLPVEQIDELIALVEAYQEQPV